MTTLQSSPSGHSFGSMIHRSYSKPIKIMTKKAFGRDDVCVMIVNPPHKYIMLFPWGGGLHKTLLSWGCTMIALIFSYRMVLGLLGGSFVWGWGKKGGERNRGLYCWLDHLF